MNQTTPTYLIKTKPFVHKKRAMPSPLHNNDAMEPLGTRNEGDERKKPPIELSLASERVVCT